MACPCRAIRNVVRRFPGGTQLVNLLPVLREEVGIEDKMMPPNGGITRQQVLDEARSWLGTPFHHGQQCKGAGVDCGQFLIGVYYNVGCIPCVETDYYPHDFHLHNRREWYIELISQFSREITGPPQPADVVLFKLSGGLVYSHGAIVVQWPKVIHSFIHRGVMWADATQGFLKNSPIKFFEADIFRGV
jgi:cell wall-associated NlpC family hydrolase